MNNICYIEDCMKICYDKIGKLELKIQSSEIP